MKKINYIPSDNYERNFLMVKRFGRSPLILAMPIILILRILCLGYISVSKNEILELTLLKLVTSKYSPDFSPTRIQGAAVAASLVLSLFFAFVFFGVYISSVDPSKESSPQKSLSIVQKWSVIQLVFLIAVFSVMMIFTAAYFIKGPVFFADIFKLSKAGIQKAESKKWLILLVMAVSDAALFMLVWYSQSQVEFIKSIRLTLKTSAAKNNGAHTFGVFSMTVASALIILAAVVTFLYYCYKDAFIAFGINADKTYVTVSLSLAYIRGAASLITALCAFKYHHMAEQANTSENVRFDDIDIFG